MGPLRSSLMNIISVYRKQAFITSSRLAARHTELHSSAHIHTRVRTRTVAHCLTYLPAFTVASSLTGLGGRLHWFGLLSPNLFLFLSLISLPVFFLSLSKCSPFQSYYAWLSALPLRVGLHLSPIRVLLKYTHRHLPHGPAYCVVHQLSCKPAFIQMYANGILTNPTAAN